ncbi:5-oxoprolinase subunit PxpB [Ferrimonas marina]|uniref:Inhibitor of KinA n=1 Tax=Ferrimonas marina TaxID=299255 RepID=A0A1M5RKR5_9GAMM|nr:5-oxoprolinase subunit PxpB [Ferrimonas marina]SHH26678.1 inhibitor of KinA [Ferrimonas marina]
MSSLPFAIEPMSESALLLRWPEQIDPLTEAQIRQIMALLDTLPWVQDLIPSYHCLALIHTDDAPPRLGYWLSAFLRSQASVWQLSELPKARTLTVPVCYQSELAPDLASVARHSGLSEQEVVARHSQGHYRVCFLGFTPGFAYLAGLDPQLATPRKREPRLAIPAGAVAIGGDQTGIYPSATPGGWRIIGQTPLPLLDLAQQPPSVLQPGDQVRFDPIDQGQFEQLQREGQG